MDLRVINFPDKIFKKYLVDNFDKDGDGEISLTEALTISKIICPKLGIKTLSGIEFMQNLVVLDCSQNGLKKLDVSKNTSLEYLNCLRNYELENLNIQQNQELVILYCAECNLSDLDCSENGKLEILSCGFNAIGDIDVTNNTKLKILRVRKCGIEILNLQRNTELESLDCSENKIIRLELFHNEKLKHLDCRLNKSLVTVYVNLGQYIDECYSPVNPISPEQEAYNREMEYRDEKMYEDDDDWRNDTDDYDGWSRSDIESGRADAYEGDLDALWNTD